MKLYIDEQLCVCVCYAQW